VVKSAGRAKPMTRRMISAPQNPMVSRRTRSR
jgi:hypothetical protein